MERLIEVCCGSYYDCVQAYQGGATRVELNSALHLGGLTPSVGSLVLTKRHTNLQVICMVRPRGAGFCYQEEDFEVLLADVQSMLDNGADGIAFGCLDEHGNIHYEQSKQVLALIKKVNKEAVFHRAFDCVEDPCKAMETLIELGVDRVLTSGLQAKAMQGIEMIQQLQERYGDNIEVLAGSGMNASNALVMMEKTGIHQVHSSCKDYLHDPTTSGTYVSYSYAPKPHEDDYEVVSADLVKALIAAIK